jgi:hypothetical protein
MWIKYRSVRIRSMQGHRNWAKITTIGVLCGGFTAASLRRAGCVQIYPGAAALFDRFEASLLAR